MPALRLRASAPLLGGALLILAVLTFISNDLAPWQAGAGAALLVCAVAVMPIERWLGGMATPSAPLPASSPAISAEAVLAALADPAVLRDRHAVTVGFNAHAADLLPALSIGLPIPFVMRNPEVIEAVRATAATGKARVVEYIERVPVERWIEAHVTIAPDNGAGHLLLLLRDMTEVRRAERMRVDFVANASHELRTPLASLLGFVETLQGPARNDVAARDKFLEIMRVQASRMARLIDDLLSLSRIEQRQHVRPEAAVDLGAVARHVADALAPLAAERKVQVRRDMPEGPVMVRGDRDELIRLVENLVENGIKYGQSGGSVELSLTLAQSAKVNEVRLSVRDDGPGIPPEHLPRLTERFYRVDAADSREKGGTGLGLALVKHIAARHGARLTIESRSGEGARFTVVFPARG